MNPELQINKAVGKKREPFYKKTVVASIICLIIGFLIGQLLDFRLAVDYDMLLKYLQAILSFPVVALVLIGGFLIYFRENVKRFIDGIKYLDVPGAKIEISSQTRLSIISREFDENHKDITAFIETYPTGAIKQALIIMQLQAKALVLRAPFIEYYRQQAAHLTTPPVPVPIAMWSSNQLRLSASVREAMEQSKTQLSARSISSLLDLEEHKSNWVSHALAQHQGDVNFYGRSYILEVIHSIIDTYMAALHLPDPYPPSEGAYNLYRKEE